MFQVSGFVGDAELPQALAGADVVVIPAGVPRKPGLELVFWSILTCVGMTRDDLFNTNASIVQKLVGVIAKLARIVSMLIYQVLPQGHDLHHHQSR